MPATLYLIPNTLGSSPLKYVLPEKNLEIIGRLRYFFVENTRNARRFIIKAGTKIPLDEIVFLELSKRSSQEETEACLRVLLTGNDAGILSEAGMPAIADPGSSLVLLAHNRGITVKPLSGPSSISLALAASGLNGQEFVFHGYLPAKTSERIHAVRLLERTSRETGHTQIFMETPYRNMAMLETLTRFCHPRTLLCVACDLSLETEWIRTQPIAQWKGNLPDLHKRPAIFLISSERQSN